MSKSGWLAPAGVSAIATVIFAFIAFFKDTVLRHFRRPKLRGELQTEPPDTSFVPAWGGSKFAYFRLKVWNKGKTAANKVEVYARKLQLNEAAGVRDYKDFLPMNLTWSHLREGENIYLQTIPPKTYKHCDLGQIGKLDVQVGSPVWNEVAPLNVLLKNTPDLNDSSTYFILSTQSPGTNYQNYLPKGDYLLTVVLAASNAKPHEIVIRIAHRGDVLAHMLIGGTGPSAEIVGG